MDVVNFEHSVKDIPVPSRKEYQQMMINSTEKFTKNLRWKVLHFLKPFKKQSKETYGFKSPKDPKAIPETKDFENDLIDLIKNIEFVNKTNPFQQKSKNEKEMIMNKPKMIISADKTSNFYKVDPEKYKDLVKSNVEAEYKKEHVKNVQKVNKAHKTIVKKLGIEDRVFIKQQKENALTH